MLARCMTRVPITADWSLDPGVDEVERRVHDGDLVLAAGRRRTVYASVFQATNATADSAIATMLESREQAPVRTFERADTGLVARAYLLPEHHDSGDGYWGLNTWTAADNSVACVTFYFEALADLDWALAAWQSVHCGP